MSAPSAILLIVATWAACGVLNAGLMYAYFQRTFSEFADLFREDDTRRCILHSIFGPVALIATVICGFHRAGWLFPGRRP